MITPGFGPLPGTNNNNLETSKRIERDTQRLKVLKEHNPNIVFLILTEREYIIDGYDGDLTYMKIKDKVQATLREEQGMRSNL